MEASEIAMEIAKSPMSLLEKLDWHFSNFDKPIPKVLIPVAVKAIELANAGGDLSTFIDLPEGIKFQGFQFASAHDVIEGHYLWYYLDNPELFKPETS